MSFALLITTRGVHTELYMNLTRASASRELSSPHYQRGRSNACENLYECSTLLCLFVRATIFYPAFACCYSDCRWTAFASQPLRSKTIPIKLTFYKLYYLTETPLTTDIGNLRNDHYVWNGQELLTCSITFVPCVCGANATPKYWYDGIWLPGKS